MHPIRKKRLVSIVAILVVLGVAIALVLYALRQNINLFYTPSEVIAGKAPFSTMIRVGGLVVSGSVQKEPENLKVRFQLTDTESTVVIEYQGILPDLFREGQGIVARGIWQGTYFLAEEVLAKHDENYMPPEVKEALERAHKEKQQ